jgi:hypothetical protein
MTFNAHIKNKSIPAGYGTKRLFVSRKALINEGKNAF